MPKKPVQSKNVIPAMNKAEEEEQFDFLFFAGLVVIIVIVVGILTVSVFLQRTPETYSQVYLNQDKVIDSIQADQLFQVSFFIDSMEGKTMDYSYRILAENEEKLAGKVSVANNESKEITETISFKNPSIEKSKVLIEITKTEKEAPYTLWFWVKVL